MAALTPAQRAAVVELLRCAYDVGGHFPILDAADPHNEHHCEPLLDLAYACADGAWQWGGGNMSVADRCLEAAQLVEEGWTP